MWYVLIAAALLILLYILALRGRTRHPLLRKLRRWKYAHRGLHNNGIPENSMAAFQLALEQGYGLELDVHLLADGNLAVIHDSSLLRTANADVCIENLTIKDLANYPLGGTTEIIPTLRQVLDLCDGKSPLIIELKSHENNHKLLTETTCQMLENYGGMYCIESFDPRCIRWLMKNRPDVLRGQLAHNSLHDKNTKVPYMLRFIMTNLLSNFWNRPDFIAYAFENRQRLSVRLARNLWKIQGVAWTLCNQYDFNLAEQENWIPIFEGFEP